MSDILPGGHTSGGNVLEGITPIAAVDRLSAVLDATARPGHAAISPLSGALNEYEMELGSDDQRVIQTAVTILLQRATRSLASDSTRRTLKDLLFLSSEVLRDSSPRVRLQARGAAVAMVDALASAGELELGLAALHFLATIGMDDDEDRLERWTAAIGPAAGLPATMILLKHAPRRAARWILLNLDDDESAQNVFGTVIDLLRSGHIAADPWGISSPDTQMWVYRQLELGIRDSNTHRTIAAELLELLGAAEDEVKMPDRDLGDQFEQPDGGSELSNTEGASASAIPPRLLAQTGLQEFDPENARLEVLNSVRTSSET